MPDTRLNARQYEEQILKELQGLPKEMLPKVLRFITLMREEFFTQETRQSPPVIRENTGHERTRQLLATSTGNWAQNLSAERDDRV